MLTEAVTQEGVNHHILTATSQYNLVQHTQHGSYLASSSIGSYNHNMAPTHQFNGHNVTTTGQQSMSGIEITSTKKNVPNPERNPSESVSTSDDAASSKNIINPQPQEPAECQEPQVDLQLNISNVVCSYSLHCHLDLRKIALTAANVTYKRGQGRVEMRIRSPPVNAWIYSSGKIVQNGAKSEGAAKLGARRVARVLQKLGYKVKFRNYRVTNVMANCSLPFGVKLTEFATNHPIITHYEQEIHSGCELTLDQPLLPFKANINIHQTGNVTILGCTSVENVQRALEVVYSMVVPYQKPLPPEQAAKAAKEMIKRKGTQLMSKHKRRRRFEFGDEDPDLAGFVVDDYGGDSSETESSESEAEFTDTDSD